MGTIPEMVRSLSAKLDELEAGAPCTGDWIRLHAAVMRTAISARDQLARMCPSERDDVIDELRFIKLCAEARMLDRYR